MYQTLLRPLLYCLSPEFAHHLAFFLLRMVYRVPLGARLLSAFRYADPALRVSALGKTFENPVILAAGFDKDAIGFRELSTLGFGAIEVGTLTGQAQPGNPTPRLFRLPKDRALINRMGFNNRGSADAAGRLAAPHTVPVGINIGKTKSVPESGAIEDYVLSTRLLAPYADYLVVNVSSPNTPGLRALQSIDSLRPLLAAVRQEILKVREEPLPLLVKIAPDLANEDIDAIAHLALELSLDGIIATNTTTTRDGLNTPDAVVELCGKGGLSGPVLERRSLEVLRRLRSIVEDRVCLVSVGGIETGEDAYRRIQAGATLVQIYTGFVYGGPSTPGQICRKLARMIRHDGYANVEDAVGHACSTSRPDS
ncbi:MAG: quinone-dependent dihydroorotate dehydrogenase [Myxococcota bacterium]